MCINKSTLKLRRDFLDFFGLEVEKENTIVNQRTKRVLGKIKMEEPLQIQWIHSGRKVLTNPVYNKGEEDKVSLAFRSETASKEQLVVGRFSRQKNTSVTALSYTRFYNGSVQSEVEMNSRLFDGTTLFKLRRKDDMIEVTKKEDQIVVRHEKNRQLRLVATIKEQEQAVIIKYPQKTSYHERYYYNKDFSFLEDYLVAYDSAFYGMLRKEGDRLQQEEVNLFWQATASCLKEQPKSLYKMLFEPVKRKP